MSYALRSDSPRRAFAGRAGALLKRALAERGIGYKTFAGQIGMGGSSVRQYLGGYNLPRLSTAVRMDDALALSGQLVAIIREARTERCEAPGCGRTFLNPEGSPQKFCSDSCEGLVKKIRGEGPGYTAKRALRAEQRLEAVSGELEVARAAVAAMCRSCEPEGICRIEDCALRPVSPYPYAAYGREAQPAPGPYGTAENRARTVGAVRETLQRRWADPAARQANAEAQQRRWANYTPEQRAAISERISRGRKAS